MSLESVTWRRTNLGETLTVARIDPTDYRKHAAGILNVLAVAYDRAFASDGSGYLPDDKAFEFFDTLSSKALDTQAERMKRYTDEFGSVYWAAYGSRYYTAGNDLIGIAKTSESRPSWRRVVGRPNMYINDIAVVEPRRGIGSALLWSSSTDFHDNRTAVADVLPGEGEPFFAQATFTPYRQIEDLELGEYSIPQTRYEAVAIGGMRRQLELHQPWLLERDEHHG